MKTASYKFLVALAAITLPLAFTACGDDDPEPSGGDTEKNEKPEKPKGEKAERVELSNNSRTLYLGDEPDYSYSVLFTVSPEDADKGVTVTFSKSGVCSATVEYYDERSSYGYDGNITLTALSGGKVTMTVTADTDPSVKATAEISVLVPYEPSSVSKPNAWSISGAVKGADGKWYLRTDIHDAYEYNGQWLTKVNGVELVRGEAKKEYRGLTEKLNYYTNSSGRVTEAVVQNYVGNKVEIPGSTLYGSLVDATYKYQYNGDGTLKQITLTRLYYGGYYGATPKDASNIMIEDDVTFTYIWSGGDITSLTSKGTRHISYWTIRDEYIQGEYSNDEVNWTNSFQYSDELNDNNLPLFNFFVPTFFGSPVYGDNLAVFGLYGKGTKHLCTGFTNTLGGNKTNIGVRVLKDNSYMQTQLVKSISISGHFERRFNEFEPELQYFEFTRLVR